MGLINRLFSRQTNKTVNDLLMAIQKISQNDNPHTRNELYRVLLKSKLIIATAKPIDATLGGTEGTSVEFITSKNASGQLVLPVFTDIEALLLWIKQGSSYVEMQAKDIFSLALHNGTAVIVVNPAGPIIGELSYKELQFLAEGAIPPVDDAEGSPSFIPKGSKVMIGTPAKQPTEGFIKQLKDGLASHSEIEAVTIFKCSPAGVSLIWLLA